MNSKVKLFVYGSLMRDRENHRYLEGSQYVCDGILKGYGLYNVDKDYPGIVKKPGSSVKGEVYRVGANKLEALDAFEGFEYKRIEEEIVLNENKFIKACVYAWKLKVDEKDFVNEESQPWVKRDMY